MCMPTLVQCLWRPEEVDGLPRARITCGCEAPSVLVQETVLAP